ncbi:hypothetical protein GCM10009677_24240 [Sphaerisporangium rubeum]|uniref:Putative O-methyltransferase YrrM n=1 Tax=Sphaerisporangium rubeum TaxID=321317 RepID=A0A7X0I9L0_9ACTN|nr:class I SAM-dependent methyltransferase [Sphaerisporangium rubeum]MBB6471136.1 putative O-methyltransferase YrrM [Sphaerisporangium rubeum]
MRTPPPRLLLAASAAVAGTAVLALVPLSASGLLEPLQAVQLAVSIVTLALAAVLVLYVRRTDGKAQRVDNRVKRQEAALSRAGSDLARVAAALDGLAARLDENARGHVREVLTVLGEDRMELAAQSDRLAELAAAVSGLDTAGREIRTGLATLTSATRQNYSQLEALVDVRSLLQPRAPLPPLRGWAASPDVLRLLIERIATTHPKTILECGSGSSTIWLAYAAQRFAGNHVIALEHDERFAEATQALILAHGLQDVAEVRLAPLTDWHPAADPDEESIPWYATRALSDLPEIGLVFVDGPPGATAPAVRYPAVPALLPYCSADAWIVLDDADRPAEKAIVERWLAEYPELTAVSHKAEKGAVVLRRGH